MFQKTFLLVAVATVFAGAHESHAAEPIHVGFLWHMHQPVYYPGETIAQTNAAGHFSFSVADVHNQRFGPYTSWPKNAIDAGSSLPHLGAQVSFSGSLMENLNNLEAAGTNGGMWNNWESSYRAAINNTTTLGNSRLEMVGFGYHHPLMPLLDERDIRMQIKMHKLAHEQTWGPGVPYSKGIFPAETAFSTRIIPSLVAEGLEWAIVDSIHLDRATVDFPHQDASGIAAPNRADQLNPSPTASGGSWVNLNNVYAPTAVSAPDSYRPHNVQHVDPATGAVTQMVAVPAARYEGHEDGRGGYGALLYEQVMDQYRAQNTDPDRPMLVVLHHDGDNFGGGSEAYYNSNFQNMVDWASNTPNYDVTTIQDYLDRFPVPQDDLVHIESGSWLGADAGDPEFKKWLGDPNSEGWSPDRNSWAVLTAAKNRVFTADDALPVGDLTNVQSGTGTPTERAWHFLLQAQASDHWYWDGTEVWDSNVTRGSNLAVAQADQVISTLGGQESTPPTVFLPQRESYNPGGDEFGTTQPSDFEVWTYAYDVSGLENVTLKYRLDADGVNPLGSTENETYAGGSEVGSWISLDMTASDVAPPAGILPATYRAEQFAATIAGHEDVLIDYYVEATDSLGNLTRSDIQHVYVGAAAVVGNDRVAIAPHPALAGQEVTITYDSGGTSLASAQQVFAYYSFNDWQAGITQTAMTLDPASGDWVLDLDVLASATQLDVVFNDGGNVWDNNNGQDWHFAVEGGEPSFEFVMDGQLDATATAIAAAGDRQLYVQLDGTRLYVATDAAGDGQDVFIYLADEPGELTAANWAKSGSVAQWDAFLADENDNGFQDWFDATGAIGSASSETGVVEGVIDLAAEFGELPDDVYLAVGLFDTADGGQLISLLQVPASLNDDGNLDATEFVRLVTRPTLAGDYNDDGIVDAADYTLWRNTLGTTGTNLAADGDGSGTIDQGDYAVWRANFGQTADAAITLANVPEPATILLLLSIACIAACQFSRSTSREKP